MKERWQMQLQLSSLADENRKDDGIVVLANNRFSLRARDLESLNATFIPFTAQTRMSGIKCGRAHYP